MTDMISSHNGKGSTRSAKSANPTILLDNLNREKKYAALNQQKRKFVNQ
jgi:hypothetical protein